MNSILKNIESNLGSFRKYQLQGYRPVLLINASFKVENALIVLSSSHNFYTT